MTTYYSAEDLVLANRDLYTLPDVFFQINQMLRDQHCSIDEIGEVISHDPGLCARLLKIVNSPYYGLPARIDTVSRAIAVIGIDDLYNMVVATSVIDRFSGISVDLIDMHDFWSQSIQCGILSRLLAKQSAVLHSERLFLIGLLHELGSMLIYQHLPEESQFFLRLADRGFIGLAELQTAKLGFNYADVGAALLKSWQLPSSVYDVIGQQLSPRVAQTHKLETYLLHTANHLLPIGLYQSAPDEAIAEIESETLSFLRISREQLPSVLQQAQQEFNAVFEFFGLTPKPKKTPAH